MKKVLETLTLAILAGFLISIGGTIFLSCENKIIGSFLFAIGLFFIVVYQFKLYTGMIGYAPKNDIKTNLMLPIVLIGNFIGTAFVGYILRLTRILSLLNTKVTTIVNTKLDDTWYSILILSFFCGALMYLAVNTYKKAKDSIVKVLAIFICVIVFIISQFEHCIANMFYFNFANAWSIKTVFYLLIMIIGNSLGGMFIPIIENLIKHKEFE